MLLNFNFTIIFSTTKQQSSIQNNDKNQRQHQCDLLAVDTYTSVNKLLQSFISGVSKQKQIKISENHVVNYSN